MPDACSGANRVRKPLMLLLWPLDSAGVAHGHAVWTVAASADAEFCATSWARSCEETSSIAEFSCAILSAKSCAFHNRLLSATMRWHTSCAPSGCGLGARVVENVQSMWHLLCSFRIFLLVFEEPRQLQLLILAQQCR